MTAFLALAGLSYVYLTLQLYDVGKRRKAVENEGYLKMIPISEANIVRLTIPPRSPDEDTIQPVVNPSAAK